MEVRYLFLHPPDSAEILFSTPLIRAIVKSVKYAEVICAVPKQYHWLLENNPFVSSLILFDQNPSKNIEEFRNVKADYLIDLTGGMKTSRFKNRMRVVDFTFPYKKLRNIRSLTSRLEAGDLYRQAGMELLSMFDLVEDGSVLDLFYSHNRTFLERALPESFLDSYAVLDMPAPGSGEEDIAEPLSELISRIEHPLVLCGGEQWRPSGEEIMRKTGCTILSTCGDFTEQEQVYIRSGARVLLNIEKGREIWSMVLKKPHFFVDISAVPSSWKEQVESIRNYLKQE